MFFREMMKKVKRIIFLPPVPTLLIAVPSFILVTWVLIKENVNPVISYASYIVSVYAMIITVTGVVGVVKWIRVEISAHPLVKNCLIFPGLIDISKKQCFGLRYLYTQG